MRPGLSYARTCRRPGLVLALALAAAGSGCSGATEPVAWATLTLVSGDNQTVKMDPVRPLTDFSQPVVVHLDSLGTPISEGELRVAVWMNGMPGPNGPYAFTTGSDGVASMQLVVSNIPGPVRIEVSYVRCVRLGFFACDLEKTFATLSMSAVAVR
jgi:hypothetical protein